VAGSSVEPCVEAKPCGCEAHLGIVLGVLGAIVAIGLFTVYFADLVRACRRVWAWVLDVPPRGLVVGAAIAAVVYLVR